MVPCQSCIFSVTNDRAAASFLGLTGSSKEGSAARKYSSLYNVQEHTRWASYKRWVEVDVAQAFAAGESVKPLMVAVAQSALWCHLIQRRYASDLQNVMRKQLGKATSGIKTVQVYQRQLLLT